MADREKVIKELEEVKEYIRTRSNGSGSKKCRLMDVCNAAIILLKEQDEQKRKWLQAIADNQLAIADNQLANAPTDMMDATQHTYYDGVWNGLQMAWDILTKGQ